MASSVIPPVVIKIGGGILSNLGNFWSQVKALPPPVVIVHGGGAQSTALARQLNHDPRIIHGRRVTTDLDLAIAEWAMRGSINVRLVAGASTHGLKCVGLSGVDGNLMIVRKREPWTISGETIDFGWVGEIEHIDTHVLHTLMDTNYIPVIAPLGLDSNGHRYNVNADTVAGALATSLNARELLLVTGTGGLLRDASCSDTLLTTCSKADYEQGLSENWITGGMGVKLHIALQVLQSDIDRVYILGPDDLLKKQHATRVVIDNQ